MLSWRVGCTKKLILEGSKEGSLPHQIWRRELGPTSKTKESNLIGLQFVKTE